MTANSADRYAQMPKVDLHRHLEGSLRLETILEITRKFGITLPLAPDLSSLVQMQARDPLTYASFLSKFQTLRLLYRTPELIARITREAIADAAADQVRYLELRFTPVALSRYQGFSMADVIDWVAHSAQETSRDLGIITRLIVSVNRHESVDLAGEALRLAAERRPLGVVGVDLAGNEAEFSGEPFAGVFREAKAAGLSVTVHAGEWGGAENVRQALLTLGADRIGHGVRVMEDPEVVALARERGTTFDVCLTSNYQSGVVSSFSSHPLRRMLTAGLNVTLATDDPSISQITLSDEYRLACEELGLPLNGLAERVVAAARASFLPVEERKHLAARLQVELAGKLGGPATRF